MALYRLVYASTSLLSGDSDAARQQIADILSCSRRNNAADDITGALLFSDTNFAQVLGPRAAVERLYETLHHDPRHKDLLLLLTERLEARQFSQWSMAYIAPSQSAKEALALAPKAWTRRARATGCGGSSP
jgi:hypothetical protein